MKTLKTVLLLSLFLPILFGCSSKFAIPENATIDANFIGKWEGKHFDEKSGHWKKWIQIRKSDGTYTLHLKYYDKKDKFLSGTVETGYWWIQNDLFNEISPKSMTKPESYRYHFIDENKVKFSSVKLDSSSDEKAGYSFVDTRLSK